MMEKRVLVLSSSPRKAGNSNKLAEAFAKGAEQSGHVVTIFNTSGTRIASCTACNKCFTKNVPCVYDDDFNGKISPLLEKADVLILCAPLYWFSFPASLKAALDKMYAYLVGKRDLPIRECGLLTCGVAAEAWEYDGIMRTYEIISHYKHWKAIGTVVAPNVRNVGDIHKTDALERAESLGRIFSE